MTPPECLKCGLIYGAPRSFDFGEPCGEEGTWDLALPEFDTWSIRELAEWLDQRGYVPESDSQEGLAERVREIVHADEVYVPMMNYTHPFPQEVAPEEAQELLHGLSVVVVVLRRGSHDPEWIPALALSGGGMDLSWEIAEAYVRLGYAPPFYVRLPFLAGIRLDAGTKAALAGCERSAEAVSSRAEFRLKDIAYMREELAKTTNREG